MILRSLILRSINLKRKHEKSVQWIMMTIQLSVLQKQRVWRRVNAHVPEHQAKCKKCKFMMEKMYKACGCYVNVPLLPWMKKHEYEVVVVGVIKKCLSPGAPVNLHPKFVEGPKVEHILGNSRVWQNISCPRHSLAVVVF